MATFATSTGIAAIRDLIASRGIRAFIFDVDGVLADTAQLHVAAWRQAVSESAIKFPEAIADSLRGESRRRSLELILGHRHPPIDPARFDGIMDRKNTLYVESLSQLSADDCLPGSIELISWLRLSGIRVGAASASCNARRVLDLIGASKWLDGIVDGNDERNGGGVHRFVLAASRLGVATANCCVVEDSISNIHMARSNGMSTIGVGPASDSDLPDIAVASLSELAFFTLKNRQVAAGLR